MALSEEAIDRDFDLIVEAAIKGERAPQNRPYGPLADYAMTTLYDTGRIFGEIIGRNYRVITILTGPHAGKSTAPPPIPGEPWRTIGRATRIGGKVVASPKILAAERHIRPFAERQKIAP